MELWQYSLHYQHFSSCSRSLPCRHVKPLEHVAFNFFGLDVSDMYHMLFSAGIAGLCFSVIALALVLTATPAPSYLGGIAAERAKLIEQRFLPPSGRFGRANSLQRN